MVLLRKGQRKGQNRKPQNKQILFNYGMYYIVAPISVNLSRNSKVLGKTMLRRYLIEQCLPCLISTGQYLLYHR